VQSLEDLTRDWQGAEIVIDDGSPMFRPAAFVFEVPGGVARVEPSYADAAGASSPSFHRRQGRRTTFGRFVGDGWTIEVLPIDPADDRGHVGGALASFAAWLRAAGRNWTEERKRVRELLADELA
jgi:hypothetical protein